MIDQGELFEIPSPCKRICQMNNKGYCIGCFRSRDERLYWNQFSNFQKQLVINLCEKRRLKALASKAALPAQETPDSDLQLSLHLVEPSDEPQQNLF